jgi:hypothetical protein
VSRSNDPADVIGGIVFDVIKGLAFLTFAGATWMYNSLKPVPAQQLQKLTPKETWGGVVEEVTCPACGKANEAGISRCYGCGQVLK